MERYFSEQTLLDMRDKDMNHVYDLTDLEEYLAGVPTADVQEIRHGRWINESRNMYGLISAQCSVCVLFSGTWLRNAPYKYCPHCGAKMDGGEKQDDNHT